MAMKYCTKLETAKERCPFVFQGHPSNFKVTRYKTSPIWTQIGRFLNIGRSQLSNPSYLPCYIWHKWSLSLAGASRVMFVSESGNYNFWQIFKIFRPWPSKKNLQFSMNSFHILHKWSLVWEGVLHIMTFDLDIYLQRSFGLGLENRVRSVASTVLDGFFPYLVQTITSMRRCVACDELWPWPISSSSFDLDFENRVRSVMFSVLDWLFSCLPQIIYH